MKEWEPELNRWARKSNRYNWAQTKTSLFLQDSQIQQIMKIKKYIEIPEEILVRLAEGKSVQGGLQKDVHTGKLVFNPHDIARYKTGQKRVPDVLIKELEHGRLMESPKRIKFYESIPKKIGVARILAVLERETKEAKNALMDREIIDLI